MVAPKYQPVHGEKCRVERFKPPPKILDVLTKSVDYHYQGSDVEIRYQGYRIV
jgi:hypothetical protein